MNILNTFSADQTARLTMKTGNPCSVAELAIFLEQYEYAQDPNDEHRFVLQDEDGRRADEPCVIVLSNLSAPVEVLDIYGYEIAHFTNLNHLMNRAGWDSCSVVCRDADVSVKMLARFISVDVASAGEMLPASSLEANPSATSNVITMAPTPGPASEPQHLVAENAPPLPVESTSPDNMGASEQELALAQKKITSLTIQLNNAQELLAIAESEAASQRERNELLTLQLQATHQRAEPQSTVQPVVQDMAQFGTVHPLMSVVEKHLLPICDVTNTASSVILADLRAAGYGVALRLVTVYD